MEKYLKDWVKVIDKRVLMETLMRLKSVRNVKIWPEQGDTLKAFNICDYNELKVAMIGQDPYPQRGVATGILFGNKEGTINLSPSLELIKENVIDYTKNHEGEIINFDITLESWAKQGILMLNSALSVEENNVGSHTMLWRSFISKLLLELSNKKSGIIYVLFGETARTFKPYINQELNYVFEYKHPAYYARIGKRTDYDVFDKINKILKTNNNLKIKWYE